MYNKKSYFSSKDLFSNSDVSKSLPECISGTYKYDYNILYIHDIILKKFKYSKDKNIKDNNKILENINIELASCTIHNQKFYLENRKNIVLDTIKNIEEDTDLKKYISESSLFLEKYKSLPRTIKHFNDSENSENVNFEKIDIIEKYINIASKYYNINISRFRTEDLKCYYCGHVIENDISSDDDDHFCDNCGFEKITIPSPYYDKNFCTKNDYNDKENFIKTLKKYQGKIQVNFKSNLFEVLDSYFDKINIVNSKNIMNFPLNNDNTRSHTTKKLMLDALSITGYSEYYEDVNILCRDYWGWILPDLENYENTIIEDYDFTQEALKNIPQSFFRDNDIERSSSLNVQYRLFKHLEYLGIPCKQSDFKLATSRNILIQHDQIWKKMLEDCSKKGRIIPFFPTV